MIRLADGTQATPVVLAFQSLLQLPITRPGPDDMPTDACLVDDLYQPGSSAAPVQLDAGIQVLSETQVVTGMLVALMKMEEVDGAFHAASPPPLGMLILLVDGSAKERT
jgi:hypothetical protein